MNRSKLSSGENRQLLTNAPVEFEKLPVEEVHDCRKSSDHFRGIYRRIYPKLIKRKPEDVNM
jgi:hypothetical protein